MYRIISRYPCYFGCIPVTGYFVQRLEEGFLFDRWVDVKGFGSYKEAKALLKILEGQKIGTGRDLCANKLNQGLQP